MAGAYRAFPGSTAALKAVGGSVVSGISLEGYKIVGAECRAVTDVRRRPIVRNVSLRRCYVESCVLDGAHIEDCVVEDLAADSQKLNQVRACSFRRVTLIGNMSHIAILPHLRDIERNRAFERANVEVWLDLISNGDWALDITQASCVDLWPGIPSRLVRRDPETQVVVLVDKLADGSWRDVEPISRRIFSNLSRLERSGFRDGVVIAERTASDFDAQLTALAFLRNAGLTVDDD